MKRVLAQYKEKLYAFEINEIFFIEAYKRHLFINTENEIFECAGKLSEEEEKLARYGFVRCHQGYLVNKQYIRWIDKRDIILKNGKKIMLSKYMKAKVIASFNKDIAECHI